MHHLSVLPPLSLGIFRLEDVCVRVQDDMQGFMRTAALEQMPQAEATIKWLRRRQINVALVADANRTDALIILQRLGWSVGEEGLVQLVVTDQLQKEDPVQRVMDLCGLSDGQRVFTVMDTPRLLELGARNNVRFNLGITNGRYSYGQLAKAPVHQLLDGLIQLPNYLLGQLLPPTAPAIVPPLTPAPTPENGPRRSFRFDPRIMFMDRLPGGGRQRNFRR